MYEFRDRVDAARRLRQRLAELRGHDVLVRCVCLSEAPHGTSEYCRWRP